METLPQPRPAASIIKWLGQTLYDGLRFSSVSTLPITESLTSPQDEYVDANPLDNNAYLERLKRAGLWINRSIAVFAYSLPTDSHFSSMTIGTSPEDPMKFCGTKQDIDYLVKMAHQKFNDDGYMAYWKRRMLIDNR